MCEIKVGDIVQFGLKRVKCIEDPCGCEQCIFKSINCDVLMEIRGECCSSERTDNKEVCFRIID